MNKLTSAQVHRFGDSIALYTGGDTVYLSPEMAERIANELQDAALDVRRIPKASQSQYRSTSLADPSPKEA